MKHLHKIKKAKSEIVNDSRAILWDVSSIISLAQVFGLRYGLYGLAFVLIYEIALPLLARIVAIDEEI